MAVESLSERPIFASEESEYLIPARPPVSRMAIASVVLGAISCVVLVNVYLMVFPILATSLGLAAYWTISRTEAVGGRNLALLGAMLGLIFGVWSATSVSLRNQYLYGVAGQLATHFLDTLAEGKVLEAYELMLHESERQVAGASLEAHYSSLGEMSRNALDSFKNEAKTLMVMDRGTDAKWEFKEGVSVDNLVDGARRVVVRMVDRAKPAGGEVEVTLARQVNAKVASWHVVGMK
jgi:hypothetical protein